MTSPETLVTDLNPPQECAAVKHKRAARKLNYDDLMKLPDEVLQNISKKKFDAFHSVIVDHRKLQPRVHRYSGKDPRERGRTVSPSPLTVNPIHDLL
jgi:hypothetical protein